MRQYAYVIRSCIATTYRPFVNHRTWIYQESISLLTEVNHRYSARISDQNVEI